MPVSGPGSAQLRELIASVERIAAGKHLQQLSTAIGAEVRELVAQGFDRSVDPSGNSWAALKSRKGKKGLRAKPLLDKGILKRSWGYKMSPTDVTAATNLPYAAIQNFGGTVHLKSRRNIHGKTGKFNSSATAAKRSGSSRVSFTGARTITIPARPMVPSDDLSPIWAARFESVANLVVKNLMGQP